MSGQTAHVRIAIHEHNGELMLMKFRNIFCASALAATLALCVPHPVIAADASVIRMAQVRIKADQVEAFTAVVRKEMAASLRLEPGVVAIYAVTDKNDPTRLTFFEMYVDERAYEAHRQTPHFRKYFHATRDMIEERVLLEAVPVALCDRQTAAAEK